MGSKLLTLPEINVGDLSSGWVKVTHVSAVDQCKIVLNNREAQLWTLELKMEEYYVTEKLGRLLRGDECFVGQLVAVIYEDARFYRAAVLDKHQSLFCLQDEFTLLPAQTLDVKLSTECSLVSEIKESLNENQYYAWLEVSSSSLEIQLMPGKFNQAPRQSRMNIRSSQVFKRLMLKRIAIASERK